MTTRVRTQPRSVLLVGASSGIGLATALEFAARGDRLMLVARNAESLHRAERECKQAGAGEVRVFAADLSRADAGADIVDATLDAYGRLDVLVHSAQGMAYGSIETVPAEVFEHVVDVAINGTARLARAALPVLRRQGGGVFVIVNSLLGSVTVPDMGTYATAKWGQRALARTLQQETRGDKGVHVCVVSPGSVNTPIYYQAATSLDREARPPIPVLQPERLGRVIADLADRPQQHVSARVGRLNPLVITGFRLLPRVYDAIVGPLFRLGALTGTPREPGPGNVLEPQPAGDRMHGRWPRE